MSRKTIRNSKRLSIKSNNLIQVGRNIFIKIQSFLKRIFQTFTGLIDKKPLTVFFGSLVLLFVVIATSSFIRRPAVQKESKPETKKVSVFHIGMAPKLQMQALVEKSGVIQITAQTSGVVQKKYVKEGDDVKKGQWLVLLSSNLQGGNALSIARALSEKQNQLLEENYPVQKELLSKQKELASESLSNFESLRDISSKSKDETQSLINLNNSIISSLDANISALSATTSAGSNASLILASNQMKSQYTSANNQLSSSIRNLEYQTDSEKSPTKLSQLQKDITMKQLEIQEKALDLNREISKLQLNLAQVNEAVMYPAAPFAARVERLFVKEGQIISNGTPLLTLSGFNKRNMTATIFTSKDMSEHISRIESTIFTIGAKEYKLIPTYISQEAIQGSLYAVMYTLPDEAYEQLTDKSVITAMVPIGYADTGTAVPYIPIDAVYQTQNDAYVYVVSEGISKSKKITVGSVFGRFVSVASGIGLGDEVIIDRNVIEGDLVTPI